MFGSVTKGVSYGLFSFYSEQVPPNVQIVSCVVGYNTVLAVGRIDVHTDGLASFSSSIDLPSGSFISLDGVIWW